MPSTKLNVAIYAAGGVFKHWSLFVDGPTDPQKMIYHVVGSTKRFRFDKRNSNARDSSTLFELVYLCDVDDTELQTIEDTAEEMTIHNESEGYNCQDYVLGLLKILEKKGIINRNDPDYKVNKAKVKGKQEGLD